MGYRCSRIIRFCSLFALTVLGAGSTGFVAPAGATTLFATALEGSQIVKVDPLTNVVTPVLTGVAADSLVFDSTGRVIYSAISLGQVRRYDPNTNTDVLLASGLSTPTDLVLEPGGNTVLVSQFGNGVITRIDLNTFATSTLGSYGGNPEGLAYDPSGRLFANLGVRTSGANKFVAQLDPVTGAILASSPGITSLDGMTYDPITGHLWSALLFGNQICEYNPNNLAAGPVKCVATGPNPDGLTSDAAGNIWIAARGDFSIYQYDIVANTMTKRTTIFGLDDLAPAAGLGAAPMPEPASLAILGLGLAGLGYVRRRRRKAA